MSVLAGSTEIYRPVVERAWRALAAHITEDGAIVDICTSTGSRQRAGNTSIARPSAASTIEAAPWRYWPRLEIYFAAGTAPSEVTLIRSPAGLLMKSPFTRTVSDLSAPGWNADQLNRLVPGRRGRQRLFLRRDMASQGRHLRVCAPAEDPFRSLSSRQPTACTSAPDRGGAGPLRKHSDSRERARRVGQLRCPAGNPFC